MKDYNYTLQLEWTGNKGLGTKDYKAYERSFTVSSPEKPPLFGTSDPAFRGDTNKWNPEEFLLASLSSCHMLWYLHLCANNKIIVSHYVDQPTATMVLKPSGVGCFKEALLRPNIIIMEITRIEDAKKLHEEAHHKCFIANSVNFPIRIEPIIGAS